MATRRKGSFTAEGEDGQAYTIQIWADIIECGTARNPDATEEGILSLKTVDGRSVNRIKKGEYKIVQTGVILRTDNPEAP